MKLAIKFKTLNGVSKKLDEHGCGKPYCVNKRSKQKQSSSKIWPEVNKLENVLRLILRVPIKNIR
jgi:hypothetical protein